AQVSLPRSESGRFLALVMGWPEECLEQWERQGLALRCPVAARCAATREVFAWYCDPAEREWRSLPLEPAQKQVLCHYGRYAEGAVTVPVPRPDGRLGYVSWFAGDAGSLERQYRR